MFNADWESPNGELYNLKYTIYENLIGLLNGIWVSRIIQGENIQNVFAFSHIFQDRPTFTILFNNVRFDLGFNCNINNRYIIGVDSSKNEIDNFTPIFDKYNINYEKSENIFSTKDIYTMKILNGDSQCEYNAIAESIDLALDFR